MSKLLDKVADGDLRAELKAKNEENKMMLLMRLSWIIGITIFLIYLNFFIKLAFIPSYFSNLNIGSMTEIVLVVLATRFIFNLTVKEIFKAYQEFKEFWKPQ